MNKRQRAKLERTAYHEAGHAVAAFCQNKKLHKVSIKADQDKGLLGYSRNTLGIGEAITYSDEDRYLLRVTQEITIMFAGVLAEREHTQGRHNWEGAASDMHAANDLALRIVSDEECYPYMRWVRVRTRRLIMRRWPAIEALAQELLVREQMTGVEATKLIRQTLYPPLPGDEDLVRRLGQA